MRMDLLTTAEVAQYLRLKERKIYDLVSQGGIPYARVTGKLVFPRQAVDRWVMQHLEGDQAGRAPAPLVYAGSSDPLLDWALREAGTDLAQLCHGSVDGITRLLESRAQLIGLHIIDPASGQFNDPVHCGLGGMRDLVMVRWAQRTQGLIVPSGNPLGIRGIEDLARHDLRIAQRQPGAGAQVLLLHLLDRAGVQPPPATRAGHSALDEDAVAVEIGSGRADCGLAIEAAARRHGLDFIPLIEEPLDFALKRRSYFEPPVQRLLAFTRTPRFVDYAATMGGYDVRQCGEVLFNA